MGLLNNNMFVIVVAVTHVPENDCVAVLFFSLVLQNVFGRPLLNV
jgi:hypothetical protein